MKEEAYLGKSMIIKGSCDAHKEKKRTPPHDGQTGFMVPRLLATRYSEV